VIHLVLLAITGGAAGAVPADLLLYAPFDGSSEAALGTLAARAGQDEGLSYGPGLMDQAVELVADCAYEVGTAFPREAGTFAVWVRPHWAGDDPVTHYLMCIYGDPSLTESWARNRWMVAAGGGRLTFSIFPQEGQQPVSAVADIAGWQPEEWHHVAATWAGVNGGPGAATLRLYVDGAPAAETAATIEVGATAGQLSIGRDSDQSPDYAEAVLDDLFLYSVALEPGTIAEAVRRIRASDFGEPPMAGPAPREAAGWLVPQCPYRVAVQTEPADRDRPTAVVRLRPDLGGQLRDLGRPGHVDLGTLRLLEVHPDGSTAPGGEVAADGGAGWVRWTLEGPLATGESRTYQLYFDALRYTYVAPLLVAGTGPVAPPAPAAAPPDYATEAYGDAWDFDEGDTEGIDNFGDKPAYIRDVRVEDGALCASVTQDPYIIWGSMWGREDAGQRRVRIDLSQYNLLEMRLRQSIPSARWCIMGRPVGSDNLLMYRFTVSGTGWQTVTIDLERDAGWRGTLSAFRIDPTEEVDADIALDYVRLLPAVGARARAVETLGMPSGTPAAVRVEVPEARPVAGSTQTITVRVTDAAGVAVSGQPVIVRLADRSATLSAGERPSLALDVRARRGLTGEDGTLAVQLTASTKAGEEAQLAVETEFPEVRADEAAKVTSVAGPPDHYVVLSPQVTIVREEETPLALRAFAADAHDNPVPLPGRRLTWSVEEAQLAEAEERTDADGAARANLVPDMARRWVYEVAVRDDQGLAGMSGPICILPKGPGPGPVRKQHTGYFGTVGDGAFVPLGGFYGVWVPRPAGPGEEEGRQIGAFTEASEEDVLHWFGFLQQQGITAIRMMLRTHNAQGTEAMDIGGRVNRKLFAKTLRYLDLARRFGLRFLFTLHDDYDKPVYCNPQHLRAFALPAFAGEDLDALPPYQRRFIRDQKLLTPPERYTDPDAIACQDQYTREIVGYLRDNPTLFAWELENEMVDCPGAWVDHQARLIRAVDPASPICVSHGGGGLVTADPLWWTTQTQIDFYTYHLYPLGQTTEAMDYGIAVDVLARYGRMAGMCFLGESAGDEFSSFPPERDFDRRGIMRDIIWLSLVNGNPGVFFWNARGYEVEQFRLAREVMDQVDWTTWERRRPGIAVLVNHPLNDDKYYRSAAGQADLAMMGRYSRHFLSAGTPFDFALSGDGYVATCDLTEFAPPMTAGGMGVSPGFQLASLTRADEAEGLVYVRNFAGVQPWEVKEGQTMWLRQRAEAELEVRLARAHPAVARVWDLDTGERREERVEPGAALELGRTNHDFAVLWRRAGE